MGFHCDIYNIQIVYFDQIPLFMLLSLSLLAPAPHKLGFSAKSTPPKGDSKEREL
jgi:hypothetical protein